MRRKIGTNTLDLWADDTDWSKVDGVLIWADLFHADSPEYLNARKSEADKARERGLEVYLLINYLSNIPYHGPSPHDGFDNARGYPRSGEGYSGFSRVELTHRGKGRHDAFGYLHFSWVDGWRWGEEAVRTLVEAIDPHYVQQGHDMDTHNGWDYYNPNAGPTVYNDTMGMFRDGINKTTWLGTYVVSDWPSRTQRRATEFFGDAMRVDEFDFVRVQYVIEEPEEPEDPVEPQNYRQGVERDLENIEGRGKKTGGTNKKLARIERDIKTLAAGLRLLINDHDLIMDDMFGDD